MPLVTPLPTPPSSSDTANFNTRADAFLGAMPTLATEVNTVGTNMETQYNYVVANVSTTANSASQATTAANSAVSAKNSIEVLFLGSKASNPSTNNSGGALIVGTRYFNTTVGEDRVWTGTNWLTCTALGGTVASLSVDGVLKLKRSTWHLDSDNNERIYLESSGTGSPLTTFLKGNNLSFRTNDNTDKFIVNSSGDAWFKGRVGFNIAGFDLLPHNSVTIGNELGGGNTIAFGLTAAMQGGQGMVGAYSDQTYLASNTYFASGADRFSSAGYAPKLRLSTADNTIILQQSDVGLAGNAQVNQNAAVLDAGGNWLVYGRSGYGYTAMSGGGTGNSGLVQFYRPGGERTGYIGYAADSAGSPNIIVADNNHPWVFAAKAPQSDTDATTGQELPRLSQFASTQAANGYTKLPNGLILQWGSALVSGDSTVTVTLPIAFPNNVFSATCSSNSTPIVGTQGPGSIPAKSLTTIQLANDDDNAWTISYMVIGN